MLMEEHCSLKLNKSFTVNFQIGSKVNETYESAKNAVTGDKM